MVSDPASGWSIIKQAQGSCQVLHLAAGDPLLSRQEHWGPFPGQAEAIGRRVGLIQQANVNRVEMALVPRYSRDPSRAWHALQTERTSPFLDTNGCTA